MLNRFQKFGQRSEKVAEKALKKEGYKILERNYRSPVGEIDIIARDDDTVVFVEVKARTNETYGNPKEAVSYFKQKKISRTAEYYLKEKKTLDVRARFDVVSIQSVQGNMSVEILKNAFEYTC